MVKFNKILDAEEIILFEKTTFLVISSTSGLTNQEHNTHNQTIQLLESQLSQGQVSDLDPKRFEKISNIIKTYKQSISKLRTNFTNLIIRGSNGNHFYIDYLTDNMFIMIILKDKDYQLNNTVQHEELLILENIKAARKWFDKIEQA